MTNNDVIASAKIAALSKVLDTLPDHTDLLAEVKVSLVESIRLPKDRALNLLRVRLEPATLVNDHVTPKKHIYRAILNVLDALGVPVALTEGESVVLTTIDILFNGESLKEANAIAKSLYEAHISGMASGSIAPAPLNPVSHSPQDFRSNSPRSSSGQYQNSNDSPSRKLSSASHTFRNSTHSFSGSYDSPMSLYRFKQLFSTTIEQYQIPQHSALTLMLTALEGVALDYYFDKIKGHANNLNEAYKLLDARFDSPHTRAQAQSFLESTTLASIRETESCTTARALEFAQRKIANVAPMCGPAYRDESHKARWLANMLKHETWAQQCCERLMTDAQDYATFVASLNSAITQQSLSRSTNMEKPSTTMALPTWYGQRYATDVNRNNRRYNGNHKNRYRRTPEQLRRLKANTRCLKCNEKGHWRAECPNRSMTMSNAINARIKTAQENP